MIRGLPTWLALESVYDALQFILCGIAIAFVYGSLQDGR
jgi:hypothetical protein